LPTFAPATLGEETFAMNRHGYSIRTQVVALADRLFPRLPRVMTVFPSDTFVT
jgi:hypothetical protein